MSIPIISTLLSLNCSAQANLATGQSNSARTNIQVRTASCTITNASCTLSSDESAAANQPDTGIQPSSPEIDMGPYVQLSATIPHGANVSMLNERDMKMPPADYLLEMQDDGYYCWPAEKLPIKVYVQPGKKVAGYRSKFRQCLQSCFDEWSNASGGKITWVEVFDPAQANIIVRWTNTVTERADGTEAGRTKTFATLDTRTNRGTIRAAEMLLLTRLPDREFSTDEVRRAYLHEVGHAFGIAGHSNNPADIMYYA
ncbi:unnamed protein product [Sphagnum jensenii]|uniref:Peptidase M10 metallopeptidase domain-containing protein n=1 Tax=Sphagnum jensenii TaxID=128206 RepID=A0ABP0VC70_9BRYO